jgi:hypothetical protein
MRFLLAIRTFFGVLFRTETATRVRQALDDSAAGAADEVLESAAEEERLGPEKPARSDALTLLATLQREARLVDIVKEPLDQYSDLQIGAAARDVLRDCATVLHRYFDLQPVTEQEEDSQIDVPAGFDPSCFRVTGKVAGEPPFQGRLVHPGWRATRCELPLWSGSPESSLIVAPAEVEVE